MGSRTASTDDPGQSARAGQRGHRRELLQGLGDKFHSIAMGSHQQVWTGDVTTSV